MGKPFPNRPLRIIGGKWRGRKVSFPGSLDIRPTPDRVRETLFNWLQGRLHETSCLELYAGSGILSLEALSRGARQVSLVDRSIDHLPAEFEKLQVPTNQFTLVKSDVVPWLARQTTGFDLIFLDPPFTTDECYTVLHLLNERDLINAEGFIYVESPESILPDKLPAGWEICRQKRAGAVHYALCARS